MGSEHVIFELLKYIFLIIIPIDIFIVVAIVARGSLIIHIVSAVMVISIVHITIIIYTLKPYLRSTVYIGLRRNAL